MRLLPLVVLCLTPLLAAGPVAVADDLHVIVCGSVLPDAPERYPDCCPEFHDPPFCVPDTRLLD